MSLSTNGNSCVPPGFRFHPTDEELLYYYLKKKVSYEKIDLDVIRDVDLNKLEPWDLHERCKIGSAPQNEWYFFSHKDKKYPTGSRTNRATAAGFWKATGRDKAIRNGYKRIGMRKTLVFYRGRAPHGQKTDWIMHEYRLEDNENSLHGQEDGWVVCRVFKKKNHLKPGRDESHNIRAASHYNSEENTCLVSEPKDSYIEPLSEIQQVNLSKQDFGGNYSINLMNTNSNHHAHEQQQLMQMQMAQQAHEQQKLINTYNNSCNPSSSSTCSPNTKRFFPERVIENVAKCINYQLPNHVNSLEMVSSTSCNGNQRVVQMNDWSTLDRLVASHLNHQQNDNSKQEIRYDHPAMPTSEDHQLPLPHRSEIDLWNFAK